MIDSLPKFPNMFFSDEEYLLKSPAVIIFNAPSNDRGEIITYEDDNYIMESSGYNVFYLNSGEKDVMSPNDVQIAIQIMKDITLAPLYINHPQLYRVAKIALGGK